MKYILSIIIFVISFFSTTALIPDIIGQQGERGEQGMLGVSIPSGTALFETSLQAPITKTATTMTVRANSVSGGNTLSGYQCFTIDEGSAQAEFVCGTISGTTVSSMTRGVDPITATSTNSALQFSHRRGANVKITDFPLIQVMRNIINGGESFPNALTFDGKLTYSTAPSLTANLDIITKNYADNIANQGAATSTETVAGIVELATLAEQASGTPWGATEPHVMASENATSSPDGSGSAYYALILNAAGKIAQSALDLTVSWAFTDDVSVTGTTTLATTTVTKLTITEELITTGATLDITDIQTFTASSTWTKPTSAKTVLVQIWGAGGGGGGGDSDTINGGAGGGGGGYAEFLFDADDLGATEALVIGTGGTGGDKDSDGTAGGNTTFYLLTAYGGGYGEETTAANGAGGGGGGSASVGGNGAGGTGGTGGNSSPVGQHGRFAGANGAAAGNVGNNAYFGGGGGAGWGTGGNSYDGGDTLFEDGGAGGTCFVSGGNGGGGGGASKGAGGVGGSGETEATASTVGTTGEKGGGGGGGGGGDNDGGGTTTGAAGGAGGNGYAIVTTYF